MKFIDKLLRPFKQIANAQEKTVSSELSEEFLRLWAKRLRFFRFVKARGGFDGDIHKLILALHYDGQEDLLWLLGDLEIPYKLHTERPPQPEPGKRYSGAEMREFRSVIPGTQWIEQPIWQTIDAVTVAVLGEIDRVEFEIVGPIEKHWRITNTEFENAEKLEKTFDKYVQRIIDPPIDSDYCICPKYYPHYW